MNLLIEINDVLEEKLDENVYNKKNKIVGKSKQPIKCILLTPSSIVKTPKLAEIMKASKPKRPPKILKSEKTKTKIVMITRINKDSFE